MTDARIDCVHLPQGRDSGEHQFATVGFGELAFSGDGTPNRRQYEVDGRVNSDRPSTER